jgi:hypothetical protein
MSSRYVRTLIRSWLNFECPTPFFNTINEDHDVALDVWMTVDFESARNDPLTFCADIERGTFTVLYLSKGGVSDTLALDAIEADFAIFMALDDPAGHLKLLRASPPEEFSNGDGAPYLLGVSVDYEYQPA